MKKICYVVTKSITIKAFFIPQLKYLAQNGYSVSVICSPDDELGAMLGDNIRFLPVEMPRGLSVLGSVKAISKLKKIFKKEKFDLVQYSTPNASFYASIASKKAKIKVRNYHLMGFRFLGANGLGRFILKYIEKKACKNSTSIECVSKSNLEIGVKEKLFSEKKAVVVWNGSSGGVDLNRFNAKNANEWRKYKREQLNISPEEFVYGFVGRITADKGVKELITAFNRIKMDVPSKLVFVGSIDQDNNLSAEILKELDENPNIIKVGQTTEVEKYYPLFDVLVLPSYREGFGNVVIEAEAMGVPVIVSNIPGPIDAMINEHTGLVFESKNVEQLISAMVRAKTFNEAGYSKNAIEYSKNHFDSNQLCKYILERKNKLLEHKS